MLLFKGKIFLLLKLDESLQVLSIFRIIKKHVFYRQKNKHVAPIEDCGKPKRSTGNAGSTIIQTTP